MLQLPPAQLRVALLAAWLILSLTAGATAAAVCLLPEAEVLALAAWCEKPGGHTEPCPFCGLTHALLALRRGDMQAAREAHPGSLVLFAAGLLNEAAAALVMMFGILRRRQCAGGILTGGHRC